MADVVADGGNSNHAFGDDGHPYGSDAGIARKRMSVLADLLSPKWDAHFICRGMLI